MRILKSKMLYIVFLFILSFTGCGAGGSTDEDKGKKNGADTKAPIITSNTSISVYENQINAIDVNATDSSVVSYSIISGNDKNLFNINSSTGVVTFKTAPNFGNPTSSTGDNNYEFTVKVTDTSNNASTQDIVITVINIGTVQNEDTVSPIIISNAVISVYENQINAIDVNATDSSVVSYSIISGNDKNLFNINSSTGVVTFKTAPNFGNPTSSTGDNNYEFTVKVTDTSNNASTQDIVITVVSNPSVNNKINLRLKATYQLPYIFDKINRNVILDGDNLIFIGGNKAWPTGASHNGHLSFSNKAIKLDLTTGSKQTMEMNAISDDPHGDPQISNGRGNDAKVYKIDTDKYLVYGGFKYVQNIEIIDFASNNITSLDSPLIASHRFYLNLEASSKLENGKLFFFGFNDGVHQHNSIAKYNNNHVVQIDTNLTLARNMATSHILSDGKIIIVGGWDGTGNNAVDSATRRVEIFNPNNNSIVRVADYPAPIYAGQRDKVAPTDNDGICIENYEYVISQNKWENECTITGAVDSFDNTQYTFPNGYTSGQGDYLKTLSNNDIVYIEKGTYSSTYSDVLNGNPVDVPTKIFIYTRE